MLITQKRISKLCLIMACPIITTILACIISITYSSFIILPSLDSYIKERHISS